MEDSQEHLKRAPREGRDHLRRVIETQLLNLVTRAIGINSERGLPRGVIHDSSSCLLEVLE